MSELPRAARYYIHLLTALALSAVLVSALAIGPVPAFWLAAAAVAFFIALLDAFPITLGHIGAFFELTISDVEVTISDTVKFAAMLLVPAPVVILGVFLGTLLGEMRVPRRWFKKLFNTAEMTLAWTVGALFFGTFYQAGVDYFDSVQNIVILILAGFATFFMNSMLLTLVISLATRQPFRNVWAHNIPQVIFQDLSMLSLGVFLAVLWRYSPLAVLLAGLPLFIVRHSYQVANHLGAQTREALLALMEVVDERDQHTFDHSERVSTFVRAIAEALNVTPQETEIIASAAVLHDLGKVGMADNILFNRKILSPEERRNVERHAEIGAMLLAKFPLFQKGATLVRHHHERWDGKGYPDRLKGEDIPLGARIISVADSYQAMTEERPYRQALSQEAAIEELVRNSGSQFDPQVVQIFLEYLRRDAKPQASSEPKTSSTLSASAAAGAGTAVSGR